MKQCIFAKINKILALKSWQRILNYPKISYIFENTNVSNLVIHIMECLAD